MKKFFSVFGIFKFPDFRLFIIGSFISFVGTQMQIVGVSWHLYQLTKSPASLGFIGIAGVIPILLFSPFAGVLIDAIDRKKLILLNQILFTMVTFTFALLTFFHYDNPWLIYLVLEGIKYIKNSPILYATMILDFFVNFFAASTVIFPIFATEILHTGPKGLGLLYAAPSIGAVLAGLFSGIFSQIKQQGKLLL